LTVYYEVSGDEITFMIDTDSVGWVGLGFGTSMVNTDMITIQFDNTNEPTLIDQYSTSRSTPSADTNQDYTLLEYEINNAGRSKVKFKRNLDTSDASKDSVLDVS
jgi:hypothetical protein